jgi:hypothetical protein
MATITDRVWQHLINQGIVRDPRVAGPLPPAFRMPANGVPAPGEGVGTEVGPTAVVGVVRPFGIPTPFQQVAWRWDIVEIVYRTSKWPTTESIHALVRVALLDKMGTTMAGMRVIQSREWNALALIDSGIAQGYTSRSSVVFQTYQEDHF